MKIRSFEDIRTFLTEVKQFYASQGKSNPVIAFGGPNTDMLVIRFKTNSTDTIITVTEYFNGKQSEYTRIITAPMGIIPTPDTTYKGNKEYVRKVYSLIFKYRKQIESYTKNIGL